MKVTLQGQVVFRRKLGIGLRDESCAVIVRISDEFAKSRAAVVFNGFVRVYNPELLNNEIVIGKNSAVFKTPDFQNLVAAPAVAFPRHGCLEAATSAPIGLYKPGMVVKVVSKGAPRESRYGSMTKITIKDILGFR